jgi:hypothetical protein
MTVASHFSTEKGKPCVFVPLSLLITISLPKNTDFFVSSLRFPLYLPRVSNEAHFRHITAGSG